MSRKAKPTNRQRISAVEEYTKGNGRSASWHKYSFNLLHGVEADLMQKYEKYECLNWLLDKILIKHP